MWIAHINREILNLLLNPHHLFWKMSIIIVWPLKREIQYSIWNRWNWLGCANGMHAVFAYFNFDGMCAHSSKWYRVAHTRFYRLLWLFIIGFIWNFDWNVSWFFDTDNTIICMNIYTPILYSFHFAWLCASVWLL